MNKTLSKERQSNIELLRIIIMFMILLLHANFKAFGWPEDNSLVSFLRYGAESLSIIAVNVFVLITGYFGTSFRISKIANIFYQILFTVVPITVLMILFGAVQFKNVGELIRGFSFWHYWFLNAYIVLLVLSPLPNYAIKHLNQIQFKRLLIVLFVIFSFILGDFVVTPPGVGIDGGYSTMWFLFLYLLGRYIALYPPKMSCRRICLMYIFGLFGTFVLMWKLHNSSYNNPFITIQSVAFFLFFTRFSFRNKFVNFISQSSLMVFLFHCQPLLSPYYKSIVIGLNNEYGNSIKFVVLLLLFCILVYAASVIYDQFRIRTWKLFKHRLKEWDKFFTIE